MYILATTTKYQKDVKYYTKSGNTYTLLVAGTDYQVGGTITGTIEPWEGAVFTNGSISFTVHWTIVAADSNSIE